MKTFAIETSCDETSCAIVENGVNLICLVTASSADMHKLTGGIVPEVAARKQVESILPVIQECVSRADLKILSTIDNFAVTVGPGLIGSLAVGISAAKSLALYYQKPLIPVNHLIGHIYGNFVDNKDYTKIQFPAIVLVVSGGHTDLVLMKEHGDYEFLGGTLDDAAGEAFDKVARLLGFAKYLGGVELSNYARLCKQKLDVGLFPRSMLDRDNFDFSFSGLKTAVLYAYQKNIYTKMQLAYEFESAVVDILVGKTLKAAIKYGTKSILLGGGVSANNTLRDQITKEAKKHDIAVHYPALGHCGDSAAYIASAAYFSYHSRSIKALYEIQANPSLTISDVYP